MTLKHVEGLKVNKIQVSMFENSPNVFISYKKLSKSTHFNSLAFNTFPELFILLLKRPNFTSLVVKKLFLLCGALKICRSSGNFALDAMRSKKKCKYRRRRGDVISEMNVFD